jgi:hypothetical protein
MDRPSGAIAIPSSVVGPLVICSGAAPSLFWRQICEPLPDERASRRLSENSCDPANREREPDTLFIPLVASEVNREKRPYPRLHVGEEEIEPIEARQRSRRRGRFGRNGGVARSRS